MANSIITQPNDISNEIKRKSIEDALYYAKQGFSVIPIAAGGKKPLIDWKPYQQARADEELIRSWWTDWPDANVGIVTGAVSGLIVLDIDGPEGAESLKKYNLHLPPTPAVRTGSGGGHYYFEHPGRPCRNFTKKYPGVDFRGDGGYVVAPSSRHKSGNYYEWLITPRDEQLADPPVWLLDLIEQQGTGGRLDPEEWAADIPKGQRNDELTRRAGSLLTRGIPAGEVLTMLLAVNEKHCKPPLPEGEVKQIVESIGKREVQKKKEPLREIAWDAEIGPKGKQKPKTKPTGTGIKTIIVNNRPLPDVSANALAALEAKNNPPFLFNRSGEMVRVAMIKEKNKQHETTTRPVVKILNEDALRGAMARSADYVKTRKDPGGNAQLLPCSPPMDAVRDILALGDWPMPVLQDVVQVPIMRQDGSIMAVQGYDPVTALYYAPDGKMILPEVQPNPSKFDIESAVALLLDAVIDFPFDSSGSFANFIAAIITPVLRNMIPGPVPLLIIDKPKQGTGASLLSDLMSLIATGQHAYMTTQPEGREKENEWRKRITSLVLDGRPIAVIDNVEGVLRSPTLCALLTSTTWSDRILGRSEMIERPHRICWTATGNNVRLAGDLPRRCYKVRLDAKHSRPWQRDVKSFKHPQLLQWVRENRGQLLAAIFTMARAWIQAGKPEPKDTPTMGSFEEWVFVVGGILEYAGIPNFLGNLDKMYEKAMVEDGIDGFLEACFSIWGDKPRTTREIKKEVEQNEDLQEALPSWMDHESRGFTRSLGNLFSKNEDVCFDNGLVLKKAGTEKRATKWKIIKKDRSKGEFEGELGE